VWGWRGFSPLPKLGCCVMVIHKKMRETDEIFYNIYLSKKEKKYIGKRNKEQAKKAGSLSSLSRDSR
jgi:hypothetical protein